MAHDIAAHAAANLDAIDQEMGAHRGKVEIAPVFDRLAEQATGAEKIIGYQGRRAHGGGIHIAIVDDFYGGHAGFHGLTDGFTVEWCQIGGKIGPHADRNLGFRADANIVRDSKISRTAMDPALEYAAAARAG